MNTMTKPTENELFEQVFGKSEDDYTELRKSAWLARAKIAGKEKAELQAQVNELREALAEIHLDTTDTNSFKTADIALAKTAPQCLQEHDNEVIERCAKVADEQGYIRALKVQSLPEINPDTQR